MEKSPTDLSLGENPQTNKKALVKDRKKESTRLLLSGKEDIHTVILYKCKSHNLLYLVIPTVICLKHIL
jgi:hypothetical protein